MHKAVSFNGVSALNPNYLNCKQLIAGRIYNCVLKGNSEFGEGSKFLCLRTYGSGLAYLLDLQDMTLFQPTAEKTLYEELKYVTELNIKIPFVTG